MIVSALASLAFAGYLGVEVALHALPTGLDPFEHALSHFATTGYRRLAGAASLANALGAALLCVALAMRVGVPPLGAGGLVALALTALTRVTARALPLDAPGRRPTSTGRAHVGVAMAHVVAAIAAVRALTGELASLPAWHAALSVLALPAELALPLGLVLAVTFLVPALRRAFGLAERLFMLDVLVWSGVLAVALSVPGLAPA